MFGERNLEQWFDEAKRDGNPYLTEWLAVATVADLESKRDHELFMADRAAWERRQRGRTTFFSEHEFRRSVTGKYAWAIPCEEALSLLATYAPLVEIGVGTGYWAWLLRKRGVDILAFDADPPPSENHYHKDNPTWTKVEKGGPEQAAIHSHRMLFLCWPPYDDPMAFDCLAAYQGSRVIFVGEGDGGCTGDQKFHDLLEQEWESVGEVMLPQFDGIHDYLTVYARKTHANG